MYMCIHAQMCVVIILKSVHCTIIIITILHVNTIQFCHTFLTMKQITYWKSVVDVLRIVNCQRGTDNM